MSARFALVNEEMDTWTLRIPETKMIVQQKKGRERIVIEKRDAWNPLLQIPFFT